ncbi:hypothetical protein RND71_005559 [Anisodus tanguticus]|uniref:PPIase cyclophilin-type domain-containing protein n=1 Tax=Anisodus tanguticus TaxID=243964 RepID=A0AAE1STA1_9SOLA|nr:hypothetical protein RND71_005559 [Anisodus tanguticus]
MCTGQSGSSYNGTLVQKFFPGQFFMAGKQGRKDKGEVRAPLELIKNNVSIESKAFVLEHSRSGVVSLALSENDDDDDVVKMSSNYHNVEFLITTGPGPCPQLVSKNIVFGTVLEGRRDKGEVRAPLELIKNNESIESKAFILEHSRSGVFSLALSENDDDDGVKMSSNYHNVEFLITSKNIVFGTVLEELVHTLSQSIHLSVSLLCSVVQSDIAVAGLDIVTTIAAIPTYKPSENIRQYNDFAELIGDGRAKTARAIWNKPLKTVYISDCGELKVAKPTLSPSLP